MRRDLATDECCYTCQHNRNNFDDTYNCNCEFLGKGEPTQDMWCDDFELVEDYEDRFR